eukprot:5582530-Amphidinium_carterae.1
MSSFEDLGNHFLCCNAMFDVPIKGHRHECNCRGWFSLYCVQAAFKPSGDSPLPTVCSFV